MTFAPVDPRYHVEEIQMDSRNQARPLAPIYEQSPSRYLGQEQMWQCTFDSCWNQVDEATSCGFNSRPALQFPTGKYNLE
jgi:hypothetical protein